MQNQMYEYFVFKGAKCGWKSNDSYSDFVILRHDDNVDGFCDTHKIKVGFQIKGLNCCQHDNRHFSCNT